MIFNEPENSIKIGGARFGNTESIRPNDGLPAVFGSIQNKQLKNSNNDMNIFENRFLIINECMINIGKKLGQWN